VTGRGPAATARLVLPLLVGVPGCLAAGWFELHRALDGHHIAWVYALAWPLYAVIGVVMWWRIAWRPVPRVPVAPGPSTRDVPADDPELLAWQAYQDRLRAADPPGGPPA
jgi:hypothetical protein